MEGNQSALGRSIVLFGPNYSGERFACANIEPDHDIIKYINLQRPPKFVVYVSMEKKQIFTKVTQFVTNLSKKNLVRNLWKM